MVEEPLGELLGEKFQGSYITFRKLLIRNIRAPPIKKAGIGTPIPAGQSPGFREPVDKSGLPCRCRGGNTIRRTAGCCRCSQIESAPARRLECSDRSVLSPVPLPAGKPESPWRQAR